MGWIVKNTETGEAWSGVNFGTEESARKQAKWLNEHGETNDA